MAKTDWQMEDIVQPDDMNDFGQELNEATAHAARTDNPHNVTPEQIGAETPAGAQAKADAAAAPALAAAVAAQATADAALPKTGGTLTGNISIDKFDPSIALLHNGEEKARLYYLSGDDNLYLFRKDGAATYRGGFRFKGDNTIEAYNGSTYSTIWTAGNDGTGSGLDADMLDGLHSSSVFAIRNHVASDFNAATDPGTYTYSVLSGLLNAPPLENYGVLEVFRSSANYIVQRATSVSSLNPRTFMRIRTEQTSAWSPWKAAGGMNIMDMTQILLPYTNSLGGSWSPGTTRNIVNVTGKGVLEKLVVYRSTNTATDYVLEVLVDGGAAQDFGRPVYAGSDNVVSSNAVTRLSIVPQITFQTSLTVRIRSNSSASAFFGYAGVYRLS